MGKVADFLGDSPFCFRVSHAGCLQFFHSLLDIPVPQTMGAIGKTKRTLACRRKTLAPGPAAADILVLHVMNASVTDLM